MEGFSSNHQQENSCSSFPYISYYLPQDLPTTTNHCNLEVTGSSSMAYYYSASQMACGTSPHDHDDPSGAKNSAMATHASASIAAASLSSPQHRDGSGTSRSRKHGQKRANGGRTRGSEVEKKKKKKAKRNSDDVKAKGACGEPPAAGYIHVRARRGQATDSHSLAERVRREKISERMRILQSLVPGCDKVTGKAVMLDEIINYVQSLQSQVEFLSMKLASMDPMLSEFGVDIDSNYQYFPELLRMASMPHEQQLVQCLGQANQTVAHLQHTPFDGTTTMAMLNNAQVEVATNTVDADVGAEIADAPLLPLLQVQVQGPTAFAQDGSSSSRVVNMMHL